MLVKISIDVEVEDSMFALESQELTISRNDFENDYNFVRLLYQARCRCSELNDKSEIEGNESLAKTWINVRVVEDVADKFDLETRLNEFTLLSDESINLG